jgi:hypothetical protein
MVSQVSCGIVAGFIGTRVNGQDGASILPLKPLSNTRFKLTGSLGIGSSFQNREFQTRASLRDSAPEIRRARWRKIVTRMSARRNRMKLRPIASLRSKDGLVPT